mgnify:CR=1 FL=1
MIKVMLVDDHLLFREGVRARLSMCDEIVLVGEAENGRQLLEKLDDLRPDVVLMDMRMPVMDGVEACEIIMRRKGGHPIATVAFVTAHASEEFKTKCLKAGASDFVSKPFNIRDIERCLQKLHAGRKPEVEAAI